MMNSLSKKSFYPWIILSLSSVFLFYKYLLQVSPSVMTDQLMRHFHLNGVGLGNLVAMYFWTYFFGQLFAGLLLDKLSPRKMTAYAIALSGIGAILFAMSNSIFMAWAARALIGFGAAFATVSYMKMTAIYFKPEKFAFIGGLLLTAVMFGSMCGETPMAMLIHSVGWQKSLMYSGFVGFIFAVLYFFLVKDKPAQEPLRTSGISWKDVVIVLKKKANWLIMLYSGLAFVPLSLFGGLWGNPFLKAAYGMSTTDAATLTSIMFVGLALGGPVFGYLSDRKKNRLGVMSLGVWISIVSILVVLYVPHLNYFLLAVALFAFGLGTGAFMLSFAVGRDMNNVALMATVAALLNSGEPILGIFSDPLVGKVLDIFWHGKVINGVDVFSVADYRIALSLLPAFLVLALISLTLVKYTKEGKLLASVQSQTQHQTIFKAEIHKQAEFT